MEKDPASPWMVETRIYNGINHLSTGCRISSIHSTYIDIYIYVYIYIYIHIYIHIYIYTSIASKNKPFLRHSDCDFRLGWPKGSASPRQTGRWQ